MFICFRYLKNRRSVLIINLCLALSIAYLLFLTVLDQTNDTVNDLKHIVHEKAF